MGSNLMKAPLAAVLFASLLYFSEAFTPYSAEYTEVYAGFVMPLAGNLFLLAFAFWICLTAAVVFGAADKNSLGVLAPLLAATLGAAYIVPMAERLLFGPGPGLTGMTDTLVSAAAKALCTIVIFILILIIYRTAYKKPDAPKDTKGAKAAEKPAAEYRLRTLGFIIKLIVLPLVFCVLFYVAWYFLLWSNADARAFYGGPAEKLGFVPSIVNSLISDSWMLLLALIKGLLYAVFALPLLFLFKGKRIIFISSTIMLYLAYPLWLLIPTPYIPDNVRMPMIAFNAVLLVLFGAVAGIMLHTSFKAEEKPADTSQQRVLTPQQQAMLAARKKGAAQGGAPTAKQAADVVSKTISGQIK